MPSMLKRRYWLFCMRWSSKTTHEACVASPAVWLMSKHSMRKRSRFGHVQVERLDQRARALALRALFGQQPRQRDARRP